MTTVISMAPAEMQHAWTLAGVVSERVKSMGIKDLTVAKNKREALAVGIAAELAFAKWAGLRWQGFEFSTRKSGDVGPFEVRSCNLRYEPMLKIRPRDEDEKPFVFVPRVERLAFQVLGWMPGGDGKKPEWEKDKDHEISSYFMVPTPALRSVESLLPLIAAAGGKGPVWMTK